MSAVRRKRLIAVMAAVIAICLVSWGAIIQLTHGRSPSGKSENPFAPTGIHRAGSHAADTSTDGTFIRTENPRAIIH